MKREIYGIIGNNGTGKSIIMTCLAQTVLSRSLNSLRPEDITQNSHVILM